jgi:hypothetical protein
MMRDKVRNDLASKEAQAARTEAEFMDLQRSVQKMRENWSIEN